MGIKIIKFIPSIIWGALILVASFMPSHHIRDSWFLFENEDKVIHACMYFGLAILLLHNSRHFVTYTIRYILILTLCVAAFGGLIEILQPILSTRTADFNDFVANSCGAIIAALLFYYCLKRREKI